MQHVKTEKKKIFNTKFLSWFESGSWNFGTDFHHLKTGRWMTEEYQNPNLSHWETFIMFLDQFFALIPNLRMKFYKYRRGS